MLGLEDLMVAYSDGSKLMAHGYCYPHIHSKVSTREGTFPSRRGRGLRMIPFPLSSSDVRRVVGHMMGRRGTSETNSIGTRT